MKKMIISTLLSFVITVLLFSCSFAPVGNQYEKAGTLKKGNVELEGSYTAYNIAGGGESASSNNNFGFRVGYGISDKFDLKFRYERLIPSSSFVTEEYIGATDINYFSIIPKIALIPEKLSLLVPVSHYSYKEEFDGVESKMGLNSIAPQLIYTYTNTKNKIDLSCGVKGDLFFGVDGGALFLGTTVGAGFSSDLSKWAIRPEVGATFLGGGAFLSYGVGFQFIIPKHKK